MIVVADTSPLNYLVLIGEIELLPALYEKVLIPQGVHAELLRPGAPPAVRQWAAALPVWADVRTASTKYDPELSELDPRTRGHSAGNGRWCPYRFDGRSGRTTGSCTPSSVRNWHACSA